MLANDIESPTNCLCHVWTQSIVYLSPTHYPQVDAITSKIAYPAVILDDVFMNTVYGMVRGYTTFDNDHSV